MIGLAEIGFLLLICVVPVLLIAGGVGYWLYIRQKSKNDSHSHEESVETGKQ